MNMQTFFEQSVERQFELIAEAKRENWFFDTGVSAASPEQVEEWVLIHLAEHAERCQGCTYLGDDCAVANTGLNINGLPWDGQCAYLPCEDERPLSEKERAYWMSDNFDPDSL